MPHGKTDTVAKTLKEHGSAYFGIPEEIHTDQGRQTSNINGPTKLLTNKEEAEDNTANSPSTRKRMDGRSRGAPA